MPLSLVSSITPDVVMQWAAYPFLQLVFQLGDWQGLAENATKGTTLHGANAFERATVVLGKLVHYSIIAVIPAALHGWPAAALGSAAYMATQVLISAKCLIEAAVACCDSDER